MDLLTIDLNTTRLNNQSYLNLIKSLNCNELEIHIYNYIEQKHNKMSFCQGEVIHKYFGSRKKVALDIKQALDIIELCAKNTYKKVYVLCGEYESDFLFLKLNEMNVPYQKISCSSFRQIECKCLEVAQNSPSTSLEEKKAKNSDINAVSTNQNLNLQISEKSDIAATIQKSNIIPFDNLNEIKENAEKKHTNLTPEQIKKIYNYIKFKQMQTKLKSI